MAGDGLLHCVFFRRRPGVTDAELAALYADLGQLVTRLPGASNFRGGLNGSPEGFGRGFDDGFAVDFDDASARDAYLVDETHKALGARLVTMIEGGTDGLLVFDLPQ